jgi:tripartite-type tricarboxylate transporter receptor subunit TctC
VLPDVPTVDEAGVAGYEATIWLGLVAPKDTPKQVVDKLAAEMKGVVSKPENVKMWASQGALPMTMTPPEFDRFLREDIVKWAGVVKLINESSK